MEPTEQLRDTPPLDPSAVFLYQLIAGKYCDKYVSTFLIPNLQKTIKKEFTTLEEWRLELDNPLSALQVFLGHYGFARRGKDRDECSRTALKALNLVLENQSIQELLAQADGTQLWNSYEAECLSKGRKSNEAQNRGIVQGLLELAQEIYREDNNGSIVTWLVDGVDNADRLEPQFLRIVDIRGVGPKSTSTFVRDIAFLYDLEKDIHPADRIYIQPVDRWLRAITEYVVPEPNMENAADWVVAGKINKYARRAKVSGVKFNLGLTYFGQRVVRDPDRFSSEIKKLLADAT
ncbi:MAG: hypothetical protein KF824_03625 [Fimbriimonadaceae bacterium]|nr:MAG: hypothetical protein KF824_03625 [Fimbriimonadaceae bacterium]